MSNRIEPFPLNSRAVFRLIHFDIWASNFLRARLKLDQPIRLVPKFFTVRSINTGEWFDFPTDLDQEDATVAAMERLRVVEMEAHGHQR